MQEHFCAQIVWTIYYFVRSIYKSCAHDLGISICVLHVMREDP